MKNILAFGDSNTWGYDYLTFAPETGVQGRMRFDERWPGRLQLLLGDGYRVIEDGLNSRTICVEDPCLPHRRGMDSLAVALEAQAPLDLVIIQLGANEFKTMYSRTPGVIAFGLEHMIRLCKQPRYGYDAPQVLIVAPAPIHPESHAMQLGYNYGKDAYERSIRIGKEYEIVAARHGCGFLDGGTLDFELNTLDGVHYSRADHAKLADAVAAKVREMLG